MIQPQSQEVSPVGLLSRHLVIDTNIFRSEGMSLHGRLFSQVAMAVSEYGLQVHANDLILSECKRQFHELAILLASEAKKYRKKQGAWNYATGQSSAPDIEPVDSNELASEAFSMFTENLENTFNLQLHPLDELDAEEVVQQYIRKDPPFDKGGKEFPDAFILQVAKRVAEKTHSDVYLITGDKALQRASEKAERIVLVESLEKFVGILAEARNPEFMQLLDSVLHAPGFDDSLLDHLQDAIPTANFSYVRSDQIDYDSLGPGMIDPEISAAEISQINRLDDPTPISLRENKIVFAGTISVNMNIGITFLVEDVDHDERTVSYQQYENNAAVEECEFRIFATFDMKSEQVVSLELGHETILIEEDYIEWEG